EAVKRLGGRSIDAMRALRGPDHEDHLLVSVQPQLFAPAGAVDLPKLLAYRIASDDALSVRQAAKALRGRYRHAPGKPCGCLDSPSGVQVRQVHRQRNAAGPRGEGHREADVSSC